MTTWTRVTDPDAAGDLLPAWFSSRMMGSRGSYGFLLATGDVARVSRVTAIHVSSAGSILIDVLLDHADVPGGVDTAWQRKQFLGAPVGGDPHGVAGQRTYSHAGRFLDRRFVGVSAP